MVLFSLLLRALSKWEYVYSFLELDFLYPTLCFKALLLLHVAVVYSLTAEWHSFLRIHQSTLYYLSTVICRASHIFHSIYITLGGGKPGTFS